MADQPDPDLEATVSRLLMAAEKFSAAAEELPPPVLKKAAAGWSPKRVERLAEQLARALVSAEELAGVLEAAHTRQASAAEFRARRHREQGPRRPRPASSTSQVPRSCGAIRRRRPSSTTS